MNLWRRVEQLEQKYETLKWVNSLKLCSGCGGRFEVYKIRTIYHTSIAGFMASPVDYCTHCAPPYTQIRTDEAGRKHYYKDDVVEVTKDGHPLASI